jgi:HEAT repeat protein
MSSFPLALILMGSAVSALCGQAAATSSQTDRLADAIRRVQENDLGTGYVDAMSYILVIADAHAVQAVPLLENYYKRTPDAHIKAEVASALVRLGDTDDTYWNALVKLATPAIESDAPYPLNLHPANKDDMVSPKFKAWASAHGLSVDAAIKLVILDLPSELAYLARTGDPRGVPMLRRALNSENFQIATLAAAGLAEAKDEASVPLIIEAVKKQPKERASFFADSLLFFDDPEAQKAFAFYMPGVDAKEARKFRCSKPFVHTCHSQ